MILNDNQGEEIKNKRKGEVVKMTILAQSLRKSIILRISDEKYRFQISLRLKNLKFFQNFKQHKKIYNQSQIVKVSNLNRNIQKQKHYQMRAVLEKLDGGFHQLTEKENSKSCLYYIKDTDILGTGGYGKVVSGINLQRSLPVAVQTIDVQIFELEITRSTTMSKEDALRRLRKEYEFGRNLSQKTPYLVNHIDYLETEDKIFIMQELCTGKSLLDYLSPIDRISCREVVHILHDIVSGYLVMEKQKIFHRDIKPDNVMMQNGLFQLTDLGFARIVDYESRGSMDTTLLLTHLGTLNFSAPQILNLNAYVPSKSDIWSMGVIVYVLLYRAHPFEVENDSFGDPSEMNYQILKLIESKLDDPENFFFQERFKEQIQVNPNLLEILTKMLAYDEDDRITWEEIIQEPIMIQSFPPTFYSSDDQQNQEISNYFHSKRTLFYPMRAAYILKEIKENQLLIEKIKWDGEELKEMNEFHSFSSTNAGPGVGELSHIQKSFQKYDGYIFTKLNIEQFLQWVAFKRNKAVFLTQVSQVVLNFSAKTKKDVPIFSQILKSCTILILLAKLKLMKITSVFLSSLEKKNISEFVDTSKYEFSFETLTKDQFVIQLMELLQVETSILELNYSQIGLQYSKELEPFTSEIGKIAELSRQFDPEAFKFVKEMANKELKSLINDIIPSFKDLKQFKELDFFSQLVNYYSTQVDSLQFTQLFKSNFKKAKSSMILRYDFQLIYEQLEGENQ